MADDRSGGGGRSLPVLRAASGLNQADVVYRVKRELPNARFSQAALSRAERGEGQLAPDVVRVLCHIYGVTGEERNIMMQRAEDIRAGYVDARVVIQAGNTVNLQQRYARLERGAAEVRSYNPVMVSGALQTAAYAATVFGTAEGDPLVTGRMARKQEMLANPRRRWFFVQTEGALLWQARSPAVMVEQLEHLIELSHAPNVDLGVISWRTPVEVFQNTPFHLYDEDAAVVGTRDGTAIISDRKRLADYRSLFEELAMLASFGDTARAVYSRITGEYRGLACR